MDTNSAIPVSNWYKNESFYVGKKEPVLNDKDIITAKERAKLFESNGIAYCEYEKTTVCTHCMTYMNWTKICNIKIHCMSRKHLEILQGKFQAGTDTSKGS